MDNKYLGWHIEDFIAYIEKLEEKIKTKEHDQTINLKWAGNLGQWIWFYKENRVIFNDLKVKTLGYDPKTLSNVNYQFFTSKLHKDDYEQVMFNMKEHLLGLTDAYEVEYRIRHKDGHYLWYYDRGVVTKREKDGTPVVLEGIVFDISESKEMEQKLNYYAERDILTQVMNRRMLYEHLNYYINQYEKYKNTFSLIMIDFDNFKAINDTYGHLVGDETLTTIIKAINDQKRYEDNLYRFGGDEFFMLLPKTNLERAINLGKRIQDQIQQLIFPNTLKVTVSMGIVEYRENETIDELIKRVDELMYKAKENGKNQFVY